MFNLRRTAERVSEDFANAATETKTAMIALGVLGVAALAVALVALAVAMRKD